MKKIFYLLLLPAYTIAAPLIVEEVHERKATVYVPVGTEIKPGDQLFQTPPPPAETKIETKIVELEKVLRKREHIVSVTYEGGTTNIKMKSPINTKSKVKSADLSIQYGYNFGRWMPIVLLTAMNTDDGSIDSKTGVTEVGVLLNLIENIPGHNWIPYMGITYGWYNQDLDDSVDSYNIQGGAASIIGGVMWYPFGELFSFNAYLTSSAANLSVTGGTQATKADIDGTGLSIGATLSF